MILSRHLETLTSCLCSGPNGYLGLVAETDVVQVDVVWIEAVLERIQNYHSQEAIVFLMPLADSHYILVIPRSTHPPESYLADVRHWCKRESLRLPVTEKFSHLTVSDEGSQRRFIRLSSGPIT